MQTGVGAVEGDANVWKKSRAIWRSKKHSGYTETRLVAQGPRDRMHAIARKCAYMWARPM